MVKKLFLIASLFSFPVLAAQPAAKAAQPTAAQKKAEVTKTSAKQLKSTKFFPDQNGIPVLEIFEDGTLKHMGMVITKKDKIIKAFTEVYAQLRATQANYETLNVEYKNLKTFYSQSTQLVEKYYFMKQPQRKPGQ